MAASPSLSANAYGFGILTKGTIYFASNSYLDSFDSSNPLYSIAGKYDPAKAKDGCDIATTASNVTNTITLNSATLKGHAITGPGSAIVLSGTSSIGDATWPGPGIEPGWAANDLNIAIPDAAGGTAVPVAFPAAGIYTTNGITYKYSLTTGAYYAPQSGFDPHGNILITGHVALYATNLAISGSEFIYIATNSSLTCYLSGNNVALSGAGVVNSTSFATNCAFIGLPPCTRITYSGASDFVGTIYAPQAAVTLSGGAAFFGALVGNSFILSGNSGFHYDEALSRSQFSPPPARAALTTPLLSSNRFQFTVAGEAGFPYAVEASTNMTDWAPIFTNVSPFLLTDDYATNFPHRFYRAVYRP